MGLDFVGSEQQRCRPACTAALSDQPLCYSLSRKHDTGQPHYLKVQGNGENTYPKFDISKM